MTLKQILEAPKPFSFPASEMPLDVAVLFPAGPIPMSGVITVIERPEGNGFDWFYNETSLA